MVHIWKNALMGMPRGRALDGMLFEGNGARGWDVAQPGLFLDEMKGEDEDEGWWWWWWWP